MTQDTTTPHRVDDRQRPGTAGRRHRPALLVLEDGRTFHGESFGAPGETFGEAVFSTGMSGYQETLTDPSYHRQVVVMTAPHVGNTGMNDEDVESQRIWVSGYVVRDPARVPSSWRSTRTLDDALRDQGVVGIAGVDTRALTRHLRERGAMRVGISTTETDPAALLERVLGSAEMAGAELAGEVSTKETYVVPPIGEKRFTVAAIDLGIKTMTPRRMAERGIEVHVMPATSTLADVRQVRPDGVFFSNGPGDPAATTHQIKLLQEVLAEGIPYFGICFGNQLFGRALGFGTYKLTYGHRGINQPVLDRTTGKVEVTAHNHGFAVDAPLDRPTRTPYGEASVSHVCLNDDVVEGLELRDDAGSLTAFSVQYHPEAAAGPHDAAYLFDRFVDLMAGASGVPVVPGVAVVPGEDGAANPSGLASLGLPPDPSIAAPPPPVPPSGSARRADPSHLERHAAETDGFVTGRQSPSGADGRTGSGAAVVAGSGGRREAPDGPAAAPGPGRTADPGTTPGADPSDPERHAAETPGLVTGRQSWEGDR